MTENVVNRVQNIEVIHTLYCYNDYSAINGGTEAQNFIVLDDLSDQIPGVLVEVLFYTYKLGWCAMNQEYKSVDFWAATGMRDAFNEYNHLNTGIEDGLRIALCPDQFEKGTDVDIEALYVDEEPYNGSLGANCELYVHSTEGYILKNSEFALSLPDGNPDEGMLYPTFRTF